MRDPCTKQRVTKSEREWAARGEREWESERARQPKTAKTGQAWEPTGASAAETLQRIQFSLDSATVQMRREALLSCLQADKA